MRAVILGLASLFVAGNASAADFLRGSNYDEPAPSYNWAGVYAGGQVGYSNATMDLTGGARRQIAGAAANSFLEQDASSDGSTPERHVSQWLSLPNQGASAVTYGGFVGWNSQWGDAVLGVELNYTNSSLKGAASGVVSRSFVDNDFRYTPVVAGSASADITDYATVRMRAGYAAGWLLPYVTGGLALGRVNYTESGSVFYPAPAETLAPPIPPSQPRPIPPGSGLATQSEAKNGVLSVGYSLGAGVDIGLLPNVFVRAEYEYVQLGNFGGMTASVNNFRLGAALKF